MWENIIPGVIGGLIAIVPALAAGLVGYGKIQERIESMRERIRDLETEGSPGYQVLSNQMAQVLLRLDRNSEQVDEFIKLHNNLNLRVTVLEERLPRGAA